MIQKKIQTLLLLLVSITTFSQQRIVVSQEKSSKFKTIQSAIDAVPFGNKKNITVFIKKGIYKERVVVDTRKDNIVLLGEDKDNTIITYNHHSGIKLANGDTLNTWTCASFFVYADNFHAENLTFENNAGFTAGQAVAVRIEGDRASFKNCNIKGFQDVLFLSGSGVKQYFKSCYIEGTTDFIFGASTAVFDSCHIHSKKNSHITAASTNSIVPYGFVFFNCKLTADSGLNKVSLGRPWSPTASVTYINCWMDKHIIADGWNNWKNPANEATARYAEYNSLGTGGNKDARVKWSKQLSKEEAAQYTLKNILGDWGEQISKK